MKLYKSLFVTAIASLAITGTASAQALYQDSFSRTGELDGTAPNVVDTNGNLWQDVQSDFGSVSSNAYVANGSTISSDSANNAIDGNAFLPVNGTSGVTLDGTQNFTLSVDVNATGSQQMGIDLADSAYSGGSQFAGTGSANGILFAEMGLSGSGVLSDLNGDTFLNDHFSLSPIATLTLSYNATAGTIAYEYNGITEDTLTGVTPADIAALNFVGLGNAANQRAQPGTFDNFTLTVVGAPTPEPSTYALMLGGLAALAGLRKMRSRCA